MSYSLWASDAPEILITKWDRQRLSQILSDHAAARPWSAVEFLVRELLRARVVDDDAAPDDLVTMRSRLDFREDGSEAARTGTLVYPGESSLYEDAICVLTPLGAALLGVSAGQSIPDPRSGEGRITVAKVLYQPEASRRKDRLLQPPYGTG